MAAAQLTIDLGAVVANWRALDGLSAAHVKTAAVIKADAYGLGSGPVAGALAEAGVRDFFVATVEEGYSVYSAAEHVDPRIFVFTGLMSADVEHYRENAFIPLLNSVEQVETLLREMPNKPFGIQLDTGMNRLGMEADELARARALLGDRAPAIVMSHLACADEPEHAQNAAQLAEFKRMTAGWDVPRSLAATGGTLLGADYHFDLVRPGVGLYGGAPFQAAIPVTRLTLPVVQVRDVALDETVGYAANWTATRPSRVATLSAGYADGLIRAMGGKIQVFAGDVACPVIGRVSMDLLTVDVTDLKDVPASFDILNAVQTVDDLAAAADTIGYEILTSLGARYERVYKGP